MHVLCKVKLVASSVGLRLTFGYSVQVWLQLKRYHDLEATLYVLAPQWSSMRERRRRQDMLEQRTHFLLNGLSEEELPAGGSVRALATPV